MKPSLSFGLRTVIIAALALGLALAFNASRPNSLPLTPSPQNASMHGTMLGAVSLDEASRLFAAGQAVFIDARSAQEYAQGHIKGALSIPVFAFVQLFPQTRPHLEGKTIVTYCDGEDCSLSQDLADQFKASGLANVFVLKNGWSLWKDAGLPLAASQVPAPHDETPQGDAPEGNLTQEIPTQEPAPQESLPQGNLTQEAVPQPSSPAEPLLQEPRLQDAVPLDQAPATPTSQEPKPAGDPS